MIRVTEDNIERALSMLAHIPNAAPKAISRAINRAAETARTEAARKVRQSYYVTHRDVISTISIIKASEGSMVATVKSRGHAIPLYRFRINPKDPQPLRKRPIKVQVKRGEGGPVKRAFVAKMSSGFVNVFERVTKKRLPVQSLYGPPIPQMLGNKDVAGWVEQKAAERVNERLDHEIGRLLEGYEG